MDDWWRQRVHRDDLLALLARWPRLLAHGHDSAEYRFRLKNGAYHWIHDEIHLLGDTASVPHECVGFWSDINDRKCLEEQFRHAQKMEAVGKLAGGVAHDFNNLLTVINGYSDIALARLQPGDPLRDALEQIKRAGERGAGLTRQLLAFSRKQLLVPVILDLNALLGEMQKMLGCLIGEDIRLNARLEPKLWPIHADAGQMEQVVMNIVVNARDAMPHGGQLSVETANVVLDDAYVGTHPDAEPGDYVQLSIADNGCGMDSAIRSRIFEPFFTTKEASKGTGLGLATVYGIVKQSGGHIDVESKVGNGTTFRIIIPRTRQLVNSGASQQADFKPVLKASETVLLVEDEDDVRTLARLILEGEGYKVLEARDGAEAFLAWTKHRDSNSYPCYRRRYAKHERPGTGTTFAGAEPSDEGALFVRLFGRRHRPPRIS